MTIATIAANVAAALAGATAANDAASVVKFTAVVDFAATVAFRLRVEKIQTGDNLETDNKGRIKALVTISKEQREGLVLALEGAGVKEKDAANIASMARTVSLHFVNHMVTTGSIRTAKSGDEMGVIIREALLKATGAATYNAIEKARTAKWADYVEPQEADQEAPAVEADMSATLDNAPEASADSAEEASPASPTVDAFNVAALKTLTGALERGEVAALLDAGLRDFLASALEAVQAYEATQALNEAQAA